MTDILLQCLSSQDLRWLQTAGRFLKTRAGEVLNHTGQALDVFYLLLKGTVSVSSQQIEHSARNATLQSLTRFSGGDMIGHLSELGQESRSQHIQSIEDAWLLAIPQTQIQQKLQDDPSFAAHFYHANALLLAHRLRLLTQQMGAEASRSHQPQRESVTVFSGLQDSDLDWLATVGHIQSIATNHVLIQAGQPTDAMHIVLDGALSIYLIEDQRSPLLRAFANAAKSSHPDEQGEEFEDQGEEFARLSRGDLVGEMTFIHANPTNIMVTAVRETKILSIPKWRLAAKLSHDVEFASRFYRVLGIVLTDQYYSILQHLGCESDLEEPEDIADGDFLNKITLAEARFEWMLKRIQTELGNGREIQW